MPQYKSTDPSPKAQAARTRAKAKTVRTATVSGVVASLEELSDEGASAFELQRALAYGAARAQTAELKRLMEKHGDDHPYVAAARTRVETLSGLTVEVGKLARQGTHFLESFNETSTFHGYVFADAGEPAVGVIVELALAMEERDGSAPTGVRRFQSSTDKEGYFRIELAQRDGKLNDTKSGTRVQKSAKSEDPPASRMDSLFSAVRGIRDIAVHNLTGTTTDRQSQTQTRDATGAPDSAATDSRPVSLISEVRILDASEKDKVLYIDPTPPEFSGTVTDNTLELQSQFRLYSLT